MVAPSSLASIQKARLETRVLAWGSWMQCSAAGGSVGRPTIQRTPGRIAAEPPSQRKVIFLRELEELKYREIAEVLGLSLNEVKVLIHRGRKTLLKILKRSPLFEGMES